MHIFPGILIWMSHYKICEWACFSAVPAVLFAVIMAMAKILDQMFVGPT